MNYHHYNLITLIIGDRLIDWMITTASLNHQKAYYICQLLLELGVYVQLGVNPEQEIFQVTLTLVFCLVNISLCSRTAFISGMLLLTRVYCLNQL